MPTKAFVADHKSAIVDLAKTVGLQVVYDSGPAADGRLVEFADSVFADHYERYAAGDPDETGVRIEVWFNERGEVQSAHKLVDGVSKGDVAGTYGNPGQRLLWTLHLFSKTGLR